MGLIEGVIMGIVVFLVFCSSVYPNNTGHDTTSVPRKSAHSNGNNFLAQINYGAALGDMTTFLSRIKMA